MSKIFLDVDWKAEGLWTQGQIQKLKIEFLTQGFIGELTKSDNHFHRFILDASSLDEFSLHSNEPIKQCSQC